MEKCRETLHSFGGDDNSTNKSFGNETTQHSLFAAAERGVKDLLNLVAFMSFFDESSPFFSIRETIRGGVRPCLAGKIHCCYIILTLSINPHECNNI